MRNRSIVLIYIILEYYNKLKEVIQLQIKIITNKQTTLFINNKH